MYKDGERMMAWIAKVDAVEKHPNADSLDICTVGGWKCVTKLGEYEEGDLVVYVSIDSWVPESVAPFLVKSKPREFNGVKGERLRTIKLRGQLSQGLILSPSTIKYTSEKDKVNALKGEGPITDLLNDIRFTLGKEAGDLEIEGMDVTELLNIQKWEKPLPAQLAGQTRRYFPEFLRKTDQERVQNLKKEISEWNAKNIIWEVTEKLEGSSMTVYAKFEVADEYNQPIIDVGVCSRNLELKMDQEGNTFIDTAKNTGLIDALTRYVGLGYGEIAVQGELIGPGIQDNIYGLDKHEFHVFDIWNITKREYVNPYERVKTVEALNRMGADIKHVPILGYQLNPSVVEDALYMAEGSSRLADVEREGIVFKAVDQDLSFKAISNSYLMGEK